MAFKMKKFSGFGKSPVKQRKKYTKKDYDFLKKQFWNSNSQSTI